MKKNTIRRRLIRTNVLIIFSMLILIMIIFNFAVNMYFKQTIRSQLYSVLDHTSHIIYQEGPSVFPRPENPYNPFDSSLDLPSGPPPDKPEGNGQSLNLFSTALTDQEQARFDFLLKLNQALKDSLSIVNANYLLLDTDNSIVTTSNSEALENESDSSLEDIKGILEPYFSSDNSQVNFTYKQTPYLAIIHPLTNNNDFDLSYLVVYCPLTDLKDMQIMLNAILLVVLLISLCIGIVASILSAKHISKPFSALNTHLRSLAEREYNRSLDIPIDDELNDFVQNINHLTMQLKNYDSTQKKFFQNVSHDLKTPLMAVRAHAEGILYDVCEPKESAAIIVQESLRMEKLVEEILFLSKLELSPNINKEPISLNGLLRESQERLNELANEHKIHIQLDLPQIDCVIYGNYSQLTRCFDNLLTNGIRHAKSLINMTLSRSGNDFVVKITDDGPGFSQEILEHMFERFYKGKSGQTGLGLAISKEIMNNHQGWIKGENTQVGAMFELHFKQETLVEQCKS